MTDYTSTSNSEYVALNNLQHTEDDDDDDILGPPQSYQINRPLYTDHNFHSAYKANEFEYVPYSERIGNKFRKCQCGPRCCKGCMVSVLPILSWLPAYVVRKQLLTDVISGITVCIVNIPQGMAYAMLATLPPVFGLYLGFFAPIVYGITGTCRELALGTYSVTSIMVGSAIQGVVPQYPEGMEEPPYDYMDYNVTNANTTGMPPMEWNRDQELIDAAIILTLLVGIIQLSMGILRLGWITIYLSDPFIKGYTTGSGFHVFTSQIDNMLGIRVGGRSGAFKLFYEYIEMLTRIDEWNYVTMLISISCVLVLVIIKDTERRFKKQLRGIPLAPELVVVIFGTLASYLLNLEENYNVDVVGDIPAGVPRPTLQSTKYLTSLIASAFPIAIVAYAIGIALASLFSQKHSYKIDGNQVAGFVNSGLLLIVLLWIGPLFEQVPTAVLSAVIIIALRGIFRQILDVPRLFKYDLMDFHVWMVSCLSVVLLDVDIGIVIGVAFSIFAYVWRTQEPYCTLLGRIPGTDIYKDIKWYEDNAENVSEMEGLTTDSADALTHTIIIDLSTVNFIDSTGLNGLRLVFNEYNKVGVKILLTHCRKRVRDFLFRCNFFDTVPIDAESCLFVTNHDAVVSTTNETANMNNILSVENPDNGMTSASDVRKSFSLDDISDIEYADDNTVEMTKIN
uniref:Prestin-like n=1 Tax=Saccoglossus kowalevskii TaxID=10224 RepID=A0ABM0MLV4_SACKO|nr:PREDICTED: prestin-like [Saccoglossus kowalevskii]